MKEYIRMLAVLTAFGLVAGLLLAFTNKVTKAPIVSALKEETLGALKRVLPPCDNDASTDICMVKEAEVEWRFYIARQAAAFAGAAFEAGAAGYGGPIRVLVGILPDGILNGVEILQAESETPGLGSKIKESKFLGQFLKRSALATRWAAVVSDGGEVQAVTGATISSRAACKAIKEGLDVYAKHANKIKQVRQ